MVIFLFSNTLNCCLPWNPLFFVPGTLLLKRVIWMIPSCYRDFYSNVIIKRPSLISQGYIVQLKRSLFTLWSIAMVLGLGNVQPGSVLYIHPVSLCKLLPTILEHKNLIVIWNNVYLFIYFIEYVLAYLHFIPRRQYPFLLFIVIFTKFWAKPGTWFGTSYILMNKYITNMGGRSVSMQIMGYEPCPRSCLHVPKGLSEAHWFL